MVVVIGGIWTLLVAPFLPADAPYWLVVLQAFVVLAWVTLLGFLWELLYHAIQQFRWEKDWPILYALLVGLPEGVLVYVLVAESYGGLVPGGGVPGAAVILHFATTWLVTWMWLVGPHRMVFIQWRFRGGRMF